MKHQFIFFQYKTLFFSTFGKIIFPEITQKMGKKDEKKSKKNRTVGTFLPPYPIYKLQVSVLK